MREEQVTELLKLTVDKKASDLHLRVPSPPVLRIDGALAPQQDLPPVTVEDIELVFGHITTPEQRNTFLYRYLRLVTKVGLGFGDFGKSNGYVSCLHWQLFNLGALAQSHFDEVNQMLEGYRVAIAQIEDFNPLVLRSQSLEDAINDIADVCIVPF